MIDFTPASLPLGSDPASALVLWKAFAPLPTTDGLSLRGVMVTSIDGTATVDGLSGGLHTPGDNAVYSALRDRSDLIVAGASTVLAEGYSEHKVEDKFTALRGRPRSRIVVLTRDAVEDVLTHCSEQGGEGFVVATVPGAADDADRAFAKKEGIPLVETLTESLDTLRRTLTDLGGREIACEGGPRLLAKLFKVGVVDELFLSYAPQIELGGDPTRLVTNGDAAAVPMHIHSAFTAADGGLYTRWVRPDMQNA